MLNLRCALTYAERIERVVCGALLIFILGVVAWYSKPTAEAVKESAQSSTMVSQEGLNLVGSATSLIGNSTAKKDGTLFGLAAKLDALTQKLGSTADASTETLNAATATIANSGALVKHVDQDVTLAEKPTSETLAKIDLAIDAYSKVPAHITPLLDNSAELTNSMNDFVKSPQTAELRDTLTETLGHFGDAAGRLATLEQHTDAWLFPPKYTGAHPFWHNLGRGAMYGLKTAPGIAGAVAIAKGN